VTFRFPVDTAISSHPKILSKQYNNIPNPNQPQHMQSSLLEDHLQQISDNYEANLPLAQKTYLKRLKDANFSPLVIYDIGAGALTWTRYAQTLWPDAIYVAFDAMEEFQSLYESQELLYHIGVLSDNDPDHKEVKFYKNEYFYFGNSYYREIDCQCFSYYDLNAYDELPTQTLDHVVEKNDFPWPDLIKINVQGAEMDVLDGGKQCLSHCERLIVNLHHEESKLGAPKVFQTLPYLTSLGWKCDAPFFSDHGGDGEYGFAKRNT